MEQALNGGTEPTIDGAAPPLEPQQDAVDSPDVEDEPLALQRGWVPEEKYHGRQPWIDAKSYNDRYDQVMPVVRKENQRLHQTIAQRDTEFAALQAEVAELKRSQAETATARAEVRIQMLEQERMNALQAGDHNEFTRLDRELRKAERESGGAASPRPANQPNTAAQPASGVAPAQVQAAINDFTARYPIFNSDSALQRELGVEVQQLQNVARAAGQQVDPTEILEQAARRVARNNPQAFPNPRLRPAMAESRGTQARSHGAQRTWDNLTAESADTFAGILARNKNMTREKLLADAPDEVFKR